MVSRQAQLKEMVKDTNQAVYAIKQLLESMAAPSALPTTGGWTAVERQGVEQQAVKASTHGNVNSTRRTNS